MRVLITAGSTSERIDPVRKITNSATGRLGSLIADTFDRQAGTALGKIFYVCERGCSLPKTDRAEIIPVAGVAHLESTVRALMKSEKPDAVVHSMAVSDYMVDRVSTAQMLSKAIAGKLAAALAQAPPTPALLQETVLSAILHERYELDTSLKVSSDMDNLQIHLKKTPKIIGLFKELQPETVLVGFKLLSGVPEQALLGAANCLMQRNRCDFVLANDLSSISGDRHTGYLLSPDGSYIKYSDKNEIAAGIVSAVLKKLSIERNPI